MKPNLIDDRYGVLAAKIEPRLRARRRLVAHLATAGGFGGLELRSGGHAAISDTDSLGCRRTACGVSERCQHVAACRRLDRSCRSGRFPRSYDRDVTGDPGVLRSRVPASGAREDIAVPQLFCRHRLDTHRHPVVRPERHDGDIRRCDGASAVCPDQHEGRVRERRRRPAGDDALFRTTSHRRFSQSRAPDPPPVPVFRWRAYASAWLGKSP